MCIISLCSSAFPTNIVGKVCFKYLTNAEDNFHRFFALSDLKDLFRREVGDVSFVELFNDESNKPRGCGIVEFEKIESVALALDKMNRYDLNGRNLVVKEDFGNERDKFGRVVPKNPSGGGGGGASNSNYRSRDRDDDRM